MPYFSTRRDGFGKKSRRRHIRFVKKTAGYKKRKTAENTYLLYGGSVLGRFFVYIPFR